MFIASKEKKTNGLSFEEIFPIVSPELIRNTEILMHIPESEMQHFWIEMLRDALEMNLPAFRAQAMDPSEEDGKIVFKMEKRPAVGHTATWWEKNSKACIPEKNSRMGNLMQRAIFLGIIVISLVEEKKYSISSAWKEVCDDSRNIGHYCNLADSKFNYEPTGSRKVGHFYDLTNTYKIVKDMEIPEFYQVSGSCNDYSENYPLGAFITIGNPDYDYGDAVGWIVTDV